MCVKFKDILKKVSKIFKSRGSKREKKVYIGDKVYIKKNFFGDIYLDPFVEVKDDELKEL